MTESEAIRLCAKGDISGLHVLYDLHRVKVYNLSWRMLGKTQDAEDVVQEIFIKVFDRIKHYRGDSAFSTWLYRMTANHCLDILRRRKILSFIGIDRAPEGFDKSVKDRPGSRMGLSPVIEKILNRLPEKQKRCLVMREMEDFSYEDIAKVLGMSLGSVKSNIHRAKVFLRERLEKAGVTQEDA